jgi:hypothetical protein
MPMIGLLWMYAHVSSTLFGICCVGKFRRGAWQQSHFCFHISPNYIIFIGFPPIFFITATTTSTTNILLSLILLLLQWLLIVTPQRCPMYSKATGTYNN